MTSQEAAAVLAKFDKLLEALERLTKKN